MDSNKVEASKNALVDMVVYYSISLQEAGHTNSREEIVNTLADVLALTDKEKAIIQSKDPTYIPNKVIDDMITVIQGTEKIRNLNTSDHRLMLKNMVSCLKYLKTLVK